MKPISDYLAGLNTSEIERLKSLAEARGIRARKRAELPIVTVSRDGQLELSHAQQRLWFLAQLDEASAAYNLPMALRLRGAVELDAWRRSLDALVARHEALRTVFMSDEGQPRARLLPPTCGFTLLEHELQNASDPVKLLDQLCDEEAHTPFDLSRGPLIRGRLIRMAAHEHVFLLTQHHIVSDGWSIGVLVNELSALYRKAVAGQELVLQPLAIQYPDYAAWQRQWVSGERMQTHVDYWRKTLSGAPVVLELPRGRARPMQQSFAGDAVEVMLDENLTNGLKRLGQRHGTTLFMTLLTAWATVLGRLAGQEDVVVGTPTANRTRRELEGLVGFFVNMLPLRIDLSGGPSVAELLARVRAAALGAQEHQELPFEKVVEVVQPARRLDMSPVFQVMFAWQNNDGGKLDLPGLSVEPMAGPLDSAKFDLELNLGEDRGRIAGGLLYATALFDRTTIERYVGYFRRVLEAMVAEDQAAVAKIALLSAAERKRIVIEWNDTANDYPRDACTHELFEQQVEKTPDAVAIVSDSRTLTYRELDARANGFAQRLIEMGVASGDCVATLLDRGIDLVVAQLAILKAGGTYVPVDPQLPAARQAWIVADCRARLVMTNAADADAAELAVPRLRMARAVAPSGRGAGPDRVRASLDAAYVMYTSGSTGTPKGVAVTHQAVNRLVRDNGYAEFNAADRIAWVGNPAFDISTLEVWAPLVNGACIVVVSREDLLDLHALRALLEQQRVTVLHLTAGLFHQAVDILGDALSRLRLLLVGGDLVDAAAVRRVLHLYRPQRLLHCYGPTESTTFATTYAVSEVEEHLARLPIGRPIANTRVYVLDGQREPQPPGVAGELYIAGDGIAHGYLNRPELTAERFVPDPFSPTPGARMYRTGDLARYLPEGNLEFLGRNDSQVKLRGYRIELGEVEARLSQHTQVREAVVVARDDVAGEKRLVAYVTTTDHADLLAADLVGGLRSYLAEQLPDYMVPSAFVRLDALPLTPNGKLDRNALPAPNGEAVAKRAYDPPQGDFEEKLAALWAELLGLEKIGRQDNFFELGGHSLLAVRLMAQLRRLGLSAEVRALFARPTLAALAETLGHSQEAVVPGNGITPETTTISADMLPLAALSQADVDRIVALVPGGAANIQDIYGLSPLQEGIWFHHLLARQGDPYLVAVELAFPDRGLLDRYLAAVQQVVNRHDILRTAFVWEGQSMPTQVVWRSAPLSVTEVILESRDAVAAREELAKRYDPRRYRIDLARAPLLQVVIAKEPGTDRWLILELTHHLIGDHSTLEILHREVVALLEGRAHELAAPEPYRNLVAHAKLGATRDEHEKFFRHLLGDIDEPTTPFGLREVHRDGDRVGESRRVLTASLNDRLRGHAKRLGVSLASLCHLAWGQVVAKTSGCEDVVFGTVLFGRMHGGVGSEQAMGLYINTLPVRLSLGGIAVENAVRQVHGVLAELLRHEHASLVLAQRCSGVPAGEPLFSALFNYRHTTAIAEDDLGKRDVLHSVELIDAEERTNYPLLMSVEDFGESLGLTAQVVEPISPVLVCDFMQRALEQLADALDIAPQSAVRTLDVLPAAERHRLLVEWNDTRAEHPTDTCIHELFEEQVAKTPDAVAVVFDDEELTYAELDAKANRLAHQLRRLGVGPDSRVAICIERSVEMVVAILGILKAGGAYVPLDPEYPSNRLAHMLSDSQAIALLVCGAIPSAVQQALRGATSTPIPVIDVATDLARHADAAVTRLRTAQIGLAGNHLTYVIYTSGTTGTPKGVALPHKAAVNLIRWQTNTTEPHTTLQYAALGFDVSFQEIFSVLCSGAKLVLIANEIRHDPRALFQIIRSRRVERLFLPCVALRMLAEWADWDPSVVDCGLREVITAGEQLQITPSIARLFTRLGGCRLHNHYGPSETHVVTAFELPADVAKWPTLPPIGRPIANTSIYVLDAHGVPAPQGVVGELYLGGEGVARGYLNRPELTAERFLNDPFSTKPGARMYRTGDLARYRPDGNLEFVGRNDFQVKVRGYRIELGEIEARLTQHPHVKEAVVVAREDSPGDKRLVAYVTTPAGGQADVSATELVAGWRRHLAEQLPEYMVPSAFVRLESLPLTPNGKLDRKALPAPDGEALMKREYEAPKGDLEEKLAEVWAQLFGIERVGRHDNFFELGGHSLLAATLIERLRRLDLTIPIASVFEKPILADLARRISDPSGAPGSHAVPVRQTAATSPIFFVPSGLGDVSYVFELAKQLDPALPVYALPWQNGRAKGLNATLEELAADMVALIQAVQSSGPYRVVGYSSGGLLAYAIAQHLLQAGVPVSFVGLIDTPSPDVFTVPMPAKEPMLQHIRGLPLAGHVRAHLEQLREDLSFLEMALECRRMGLDGFDDARVVADDWERSANYSRLIASYNPPALAITAHVFLATETVKNSAATDAIDETPYAKHMRVAASNAPILQGWKGLLPSFQSVPVPGNHITMMTAPGHRKVLGAGISEALRSSAERPDTRVPR